MMNLVSSKDHDVTCVLRSVQKSLDQYTSRNYHAEMKFVVIIGVANG